MNKKYLLILWLSLAGLTASAQPKQSTLQTLSGQWLLIAANNGEEVAPGIYSSKTDTIRFTATPSADGTGLDCHADTLYRSADAAYPGDWRIEVEENAEGLHRLGWVLTADAPVSTKEFLEPSDHYLEAGRYYWGGTEGGHRHLYLLSQNLDGQIVPMTFWSAWSSQDATAYSVFNKEEQARSVFAVVAEQIPYADSVGWIEIWTSPKIERPGGYTAGISNVLVDRPADAAWYDMLGRRVSTPKAGGLYIHQGRKVLKAQ